MNNGGPLDRRRGSGDNFAFGPNDVLSGRTKLSFNHIGNRRFREVIGQSIDDYNLANSRAEKYGIVETIVDEIARSGGRFLRADNDGSWSELEPEIVRQKIAHAIRDTTKKKEAKKAKASKTIVPQDRIMTPAAAAAAAKKKVPPQPPPARAPQPANGINQLVMGLQDYRLREMMRQGAFPAVYKDGDNDVKMAPVASNMIQQKRRLGSIREGESMIPEMMQQPAMKVAKPEPSGMKLGHTGARSKARHSMGPGMGLPNNTRYELRQEQGVGFWGSVPLTPELAGLSSGVQEPTIEGERRLAGVPKGRRHTMPPSGTNIGNKRDPPAASFGINHQVTFGSSSFDLGTELPHPSSEDCQSSEEFEHDDDDFLSKINQLPGLSDADPHLPQRFP